MSTEELINAAKTVVTVLIGGALGKYGDKLIEWARGYRKDRAEIRHKEAETEETEAKITLSILKETREQLKDANLEIKELRNQLSEMWGRVDSLTNARFEERNRCTEIERELSHLKNEIKKSHPNDRKPGRL